MPLSHIELRRANRHNLATLRESPLAEISGALGDLGTLLPLMIALAVQGSINLDSTLVFTGLYNVMTGVVFGVPLPTQPMKSIASAAISGRGDPDPSSVAGAGILVGLAVLLMSATGFLRRATRLVPIPVVKGIQLGAGLSLITSAGSSLLAHLNWASPTLDNRLWALSVWLLLLATQTKPRFPSALYVFGAGLVFSFLFISTSGDGGVFLPGLNLWSPHIVSLPGFLRYRDSAISMAVGQLPLTTLNSIIAVSALSADLLPQQPAPSVTALGLSIAVMNLTGTWLGCMPSCLGSGGLAASVRFGARSGASMILLGLFKLVLGLFFGNTLVDLLAHFPKSFLGVMVLAAGLELAKIGTEVNRGASDLWEEAQGQGGDGEGSASLLRRIRRELSEKERDERRTVMLMTTAGILAFKNDAVGFAAGMLCSGCYRLADRMSTWRLSRSGRLETTPLLS
ncbi:related to sulfate transporter [Cephalotrichum gorgonifer]|uniref:Related to sulfate transporter n=1 Tax=Cephalotrichum gorgonifer TaxID=2041049 RepID=A0AAE8MSZ3_9PEZI|nr:related to sulfate transporter [Cephalotrichum gorgonifer]